MLGGHVHVMVNKCDTPGCEICKHRYVYVSVVIHFSVCLYV